MVSLLFILCVFSLLFIGIKLILAKSNILFDYPLVEKCFNITKESKVSQTADEEPLKHFTNNTVKNTADLAIDTNNKSVISQISTEEHLECCINDSVETQETEELIELHNYSTSKKLLSQLTEEESIQFLLEHNVEIPQEIADVDKLGKFIKDTILEIEKDPECVFVYNYYVTLNFAENIKTVVNEYYGLEISQANNYQIGSTVSPRASTYSLQDSILVLNDGNLKYNCYAYAIERNENPPQFTTSKQYQPGDISGKAFKFSAKEIANVVSEDLKVLGYKDITVSSTLPIVNSTTNLICVHVGSADYHFMRYDSGSWYHKPGFTAILKYKYQPSYKIWTNEYVDSQGTSHESSFTYDSEIYYISYNAPLSELFNGGNGTESNPLLISEAKHFDNIRKTAIHNYYYKLTDDIFYYPMRTFVPIPEFNGFLDGNGHSVSNFDLDTSSGENIGLFKINSGTIQNLKLGTYFTVSDKFSNVCVGAFAGLNKGIISNCTLFAIINRPFFVCYAKGDSYMGCFVGSNQGSINECNGGDWLEGSCNMGTIAGKNSGVIKKCQATSNKIIINYHDYNACVGGIVGLQTGGEIINCHFQGRILLDNYYSEKYSSLSEDRTIQICAGIIIGYRQGGVFNKNTYSLPIGVLGDMVSSVRDLSIVKWTTGALWWKKTHTHDQTLYFKNEVCGRY